MTANQLGLTSVANELDWVKRTMRERPGQVSADAIAIVEKALGLLRDAGKIQDAHHRKQKKVGA